MDENTKFVDYASYCTTCAHERLDEAKDPCNECLDNPGLYGTEKPLHWEAKEKS